MTPRRRTEAFYGQPFFRLVSKMSAEQGLSLDELAQRASIRHRRLDRCALGTAEPLITDIFAAAKVLDVSPIWLFNKVLTEGTALRASRMRSNTSVART